MADAASHTGSSEDPYFDMYPALMSVEEEQAAVAKQRVEQSLRMAFQGLRRLALANGLEDREIAAAACDECGVGGPAVDQQRSGGHAPAAGAAAAPLSRAVAPEDADQALSVAVRGPSPELPPPPLDAPLPLGPRSGCSRPSRTRCLASRGGGDHPNARLRRPAAVAGTRRGDERDANHW